MGTLAALLAPLVTVLAAAATTTVLAIGADTIVLADGATTTFFAQCAYSAMEAQPLKPIPYAVAPLVHVCCVGHTIQGVSGCNLHDVQVYDRLYGLRCETVELSIVALLAHGRSFVVPAQPFYATPDVIIIFVQVYEMWDPFSWSVGCECYDRLPRLPCALFVWRVGKTLDGGALHALRSAEIVFTQLAQLARGPGDVVLAIATAAAR